MKNATLFLVPTLFISFTAGCGSKEPEPQPVVKQEATDDYFKIMLNGQSFGTGGDSWQVGMNDIRNILVHDTKKNDDETFTAHVSFESVKDGEGIAVDTVVQYEIVEASTPKGGSVAIYPIKSITTNSIERIKVD